MSEVKTMKQEAVELLERGYLKIDYQEQKRLILLTALQAGYRVKGEQHSLDTYPVYEVSKADGSVFWRGVCWTEQEAWQCLPNFAESTDACFSLPLPFEHWWKILYPSQDPNLPPVEVPDEWYVELCNPDGECAFAVDKIGGVAMLKCWWEMQSS